MGVSAPEACSSASPWGSVLDDPAPTSAGVAGFCLSQQFGLCTLQGVPSCHSRQRIEFSLGQFSSIWQSSVLRKGVFVQSLSWRWKWKSAWAEKEKKPAGRTEEIKPAAKPQLCVSPTVRQQLWNATRTSLWVTAAFWLLPKDKSKNLVCYSHLLLQITNCSVASPHDSTSSLVNLYFSQSWVQNSNQSRTDSRFPLTLLGILELEPKTYKRAAILLWVLWSAPPHCLEPRNLIPADHRLVLGHLWLVRLERFITDCQE